MMSVSFAFRRILLGSAAMLACGVVAGVGAGGANAEDLRPAVGKPLAAAKAELARHNYAKAQADVNEADAVGGKSSYEDFIITEMRGAIAQQAGDTKTAANAYEKLIASGKLSSAQQAQMTLAIASMAYSAHDYDRAITWLDRYTKLAGANPQTTRLKIQAYYEKKDYANAAKLQQAQIDQTVKAGGKPAEEQLQLLSACQRAMNDTAGFTHTLELLVTYYPKPDYWQNLVHGIQTDPSFPAHLSFELQRLQLALGLLGDEAAYMDATESAVQDGALGEGKSIMAAGTAAGVMGKADAAREQRLAALIDKRIAAKTASLPKDEAAAANEKDGSDLVDDGITEASLGNSDKGIALIQQGIAKGGLRFPDQAKLDLGYAQMKAGKKADAVATFKSVTPGTPESRLSRLWVLYLKTH
jgi:tetratricopeptide (TPR) repeat protein